MLAFTPAQIWLQQLLGLPHRNMRMSRWSSGRDGEKLCKQTGALALNLDATVHNLFHGLVFLGQSPPDSPASGQTVADGLGLGSRPTGELGAVSDAASAAAS